MLRSILYDNIVWFPRVSKPILLSIHIFFVMSFYISFLTNCMFDILFFTILTNKGIIKARHLFLHGVVCAVNFMHEIYQLTLIIPLYSRTKHNKVLKYILIFCIEVLELKCIFNILTAINVYRLYNLQKCLHFMYFLR